MLTHNGNSVINPRFTFPMVATELSTKFKMTSISRQEYHLYTGQRSLSWMYYNTAFTLTFKSEVSEYDWDRISSELAVKWCDKLSSEFVVLFVYFVSNLHIVKLQCKRL